MTNVHNFLTSMTVVLGLAFGSAASAEEHSYSFPDMQTIDGQDVMYVPLSREQMEMHGHSVAFVKYDQTGAYLYYDYELMAKLSPLAKALIIEHEGAHHSLGHSLSTKMYREAQTPIPPALTYSKEDDADCEAGFRIAEQFDTNGSEIRAAMTEIYAAMGGDVSAALPEWLYHRMSKVETCFEGQLLPRPQPLSMPQFTSN